MQIDQTNNFTIEKNIPIPPVRKARPEKYPFDKMEVGDSFFIENVGKLFSIFANVRDYNHRAKKSEQIRVVQRREGNGVRIWRIE